MFFFKVLRFNSGKYDYTLRVFAVPCLYYVVVLSHCGQCFDPKSRTVLL